MTPTLAIASLPAACEEAGFVCAFADGARPAVRVLRAAARQIERAARRAWPIEGCGLLLGRGREIRVAFEVPNLRRECPRLMAGRSDYSLDGLAAMRAERAARYAGLVLLGYFHTHPSGVLRLSDHDRACVLWPDLPPALHIVAAPDGRWRLFEFLGG